jgi:hypothetical protein
VGAGLRGGEGGRDVAMPVLVKCRSVTRNLFQTEFSSLHEKFHNYNSSVWFLLLILKMTCLSSNSEPS